MEKKVFTVSEITNIIKSLLESKLNNILVKGEVSNLKKHSSGHIYFSLKDEDAQISLALFKNKALKISNIPKDGDKIIIYGDLTIYPPRGSYQIIVREIDFLGIGELLLKLHQLKEKLKNKGYFDKKNKKIIPKFPKKIGVITSPTGAVIKDILNVLNRRFPNFHLILNPVTVQGETAKEEIASAIEDFNKHDLVNVIILARGGGSIEDLWAFNEEMVIEAIFNSKIPIISAVGHETDTTLSDFVADIRAPTPSAAAEIVIFEKRDIEKKLDIYKESLIQNIKAKIKYHKNSIKNILTHPTFYYSNTLLIKHFQKIDEIKNNIYSIMENILKDKKNKIFLLQNKLQYSSLKNQILFFKEKINSISKNIDIRIKNKIFEYNEKLKKIIPLKIFIFYVKKIIDKKKEQLKKIESHLFSLNPKNILRKGYSILFSEKDDSIILSSKSVYKNQKIYALLHEGKIKLKVEDYE
ncbi:MAG: hypothetical protein AMS24_02870 [Chlamydiae bacterium SM23_39]|nr:MAG: hypothetical protein AMS24_02870 [Chlamydiae bacterium SM23_39]